MFSFKDYISTLDLDQLHECRVIINKQILNKISPGHGSKDDGSRSPNLSPANIPLPIIIERKPIEELVGEPKANFITVDERDLLFEECKSLKFDRYGQKDSVKNRFITPFGEPYIWKSKNGTIVNKPIPINDFPIVKNILAKVNEEYECNLNCCLISYFKNGSAGIHLHRDDENSLDHTQPIVVVSIGAVRRVEFMDNDREPYLASDLTLDPSDCSAYIMRPGTQQFFRHRVRCNKRVHKHRLSFSFRAFVPEAERVKSNRLLFSTPNPRVTLPLPSAPPMTPVAIKPSSSTSTASALFQTPNIVKPISHEVTPQNTPSGYSPFPPKSSSFPSNSTTTHSSRESNKKLCLILGTSITSNISGEMR